MHNLLFSKGRINYNDSPSGFYHLNVNLFQSWISRSNNRLQFLNRFVSKTCVFDKNGGTLEKRNAERDSRYDFKAFASIRKTFYGEIQKSRKKN